MTLPTCCFTAKYVFLSKCLTLIFRNIIILSARKELSSLHWLFCSLFWKQKINILMSVARIAVFRQTICTVAVHTVWRNSRVGADTLYYFCGIITFYLIFSDNNQIGWKYGDSKKPKHVVIKQHDYKRVRLIRVYKILSLAPRLCTFSQHESIKSNRVSWAPTR